LPRRIGVAVNWLDASIWAICDAQVGTEARSIWWAIGIMSCSIELALIKLALHSRAIARRRLFVIALMAVPKLHHTARPDQLSIDSFDLALIIICGLLSKIDSPFYRLINAAVHG